MQRNPSRIVRIERQPHRASIERLLIAYRHLSRAMEKQEVSDETDSRRVCACFDTAS